MISHARPFGVRVALFGHPPLRLYRPPSGGLLFAWAARRAVVNVRSRGWHFNARAGAGVVLGRVAAIVVAVAAPVCAAAPSFAQTALPTEAGGGWYIGGEAGWSYLADEPAKAVIPVY